MSLRGQWVAPLAVMCLCDSAAYLVLMGGLGMLDAGGVVILACAVRALYIPVGRFLVAELFRRSRVRIGVSVALSVVVYLGLLVHLVYAGYFHTVPHFRALRHLGELPETATQLVLQLVDLPVVVVGVLFGVQLIALGRLVRDVKPAPIPAAAALLSLLLVFVAHGRLARATYDRFGAVPSDRLAVYGLPDAVLRLGLADLWRSQIQDELRHRRWPLDPAPYPGTVDRSDNGVRHRQLRGFNLIMVQMESVEHWAIEADVRGVAVMPFMRSLQSRAVVFPNFFAQHSGGGSSDAELAALLSLLPLSTHSGLLTADWKRTSPLPRCLAERGYRTIALHANRATYFNRNLAYPRLGFDEFVSADAYHGAAPGWHSKDEAFLVQSLEKMLRMPEPFFAFVITMQSHGPFTNHDPHPAADPGPGFPRLERDYLQSMAEVDAAMQTFVTGLEAAGLTGRSVLMLYGDHSAQVADQRVEGRDVIPLIVLAPGHPPEVVERVGTHLDLAPTALHLLGIDEPDGWLGSSMFEPGPGVALFNDLGEIRLVDGVLVSHRATQRMPFLLYSASILDP